MLIIICLSFFIMNVVKIDGDGNCLFKAVSFCVFNTQCRHYELRQSVVNSVCANWDLYKDYIVGDFSYRLPISSKEDYSSLISRECEYAGHTELFCLSQLFPEFTFRVHVVEVDHVVEYGQGTTIRNLRFTGNLDEGHFDVLLHVSQNINTDISHATQCINEDHSYAPEDINYDPAHAPQDLNIFVGPVCPNKKRRYTATKHKKNLDKNRYKKSQNDKFHVGYRCAVSNRVPNVTCHNLGKMQNKCPYCSALYFDSEKNTNGVFSLCCGNGKIKLPESDMSQELQKLFVGNDELSKNFRSNIRQYNNAMCFVSFGANVALPPSSGPYCFKILGTVHHLISPLYANLKSESAYGQLYILDFNEANNIRLNRQPNCNLRGDILNLITQELEKCNPYIKQYKTMHQKIEEEKQLAMVENRPCKDMVMTFYHEPNLDKRRYNMPHVSEVAAVFETVDGAPPSNRCIRVYPLEGGLKKIDYDSMHCDPLCYVLLWPKGETGWHISMPTGGSRKTKVREHCTMKEYISFKISIRGNLPAGNFNPALNAGKLTQQLFVDYYCRIEGDRLKFIRNNQKQIRVDTYVGLADALHTKANQEGANIGRLVILPSSFNGSPRNMIQNYQDAMALVRKFGKPDIFITFTCNGSWAEIVNSIQSYETPNNRPDVVVRVFHAKVKELLNLITRKKIFGNVKTFLYTVEFQKRGLPHIHLLVSLSDDCKFRETDDIDQVVSAEIPDENDAVLYNLVKKHMIHGPCGGLNPNSVCMENGLCKKTFPKDFVPETKENVGGYPLYRRRNNGRTVKKCIKGVDLEIDNRYVVPYNPFLLLYFQAHINVEICASVHSVKYIHKYVYKGHDCASVKVTPEDNTIDHDEITTFLNTRYVGPSEAAYRIFAFTMHDQSHNVVRLPVHLPDKQNVYFNMTTANEALSNAKQKDTMLTAWFKLNLDQETKSPYTYPETPLHYVWNKTKNCWTKRKVSWNVIGRMYNVSPSDCERYHLRLLLNHVVGVSSYEEIRTYNNVVYPTFKEAAIQRGLLLHDSEWQRCLNEASSLQMPKQLRQLFSYILVFQSPNNALQLWEDFKDFLCEDYLAKFDENVAINYALLDIAATLKLHNFSLSHFSLPTIQMRNCHHSDKEDSFLSNLDSNIIHKANSDQLIVIETVIKAVEENATYKSNAFFIEGPGGTGKTFIYHCLIQYCETNNFSVIPVAWTGIAAMLLPYGRTVHSCFKLPLQLNETSVSSLKPNSKEFDSIKNARLIVWDEASMASNYALMAVDRLLQDLMCNSTPFGGKVIVLGGDFRQVLPVVPHASRHTIVQHSIKCSPIWLTFKVFKLTKNQRANQEDLEFAKFLLSIGNGDHIVPEGEAPEVIDLPTQIISETDIISDIYGDLVTLEDCRGKLSKVAILAPKNEHCNEINSKVMDLLPGDYQEYLSVNNLISEEVSEIMQFPSEFLDSLDLSGLPPHILKLKKGAIVILLRNLNAKIGLLNGTRLIVKNMHENFLHLEIITGQHTGNDILLPRVDLSPSDTSLPFLFRRRQFPIRLAFAITINKAQGQTLDRVGLYLPQPVFSHGQLYVALSRARNFQDIKVEILPRTNRTVNIVYKEIL